MAPSFQILHIKSAYDIKNLKLMRHLVYYIPDRGTDPEIFNGYFAARSLALVHKVDYSGIESALTAIGHLSGCRYFSYKCCTINILLTKNSLL